MILKEIKKILVQEKFECAITPPTAALPVDHLLVFLTLDEKKRERLLQIFGMQPQLTPELTGPKTAHLPDRVQFRAKLPFKVQDSALNQVASLLHFLNQMIDLPGFELNELEGEVIYRYVWITEPETITSPLITSIVGAVMLNLGLFAGTIESLAEGKISFDELLAQIVQISDSIKK